MNIEDINQTPVQQNKLSPINLKQNIQLTQQSQQKQQKKTLHENIQDKNTQKSCFDCFFEISSLIQKCFITKNHILTINVSNQSQYLSAIQHIKKQNFKPVISAQKEPIRKTLVLDLDETLIHTTTEKKQKYDYEIEIQSNNKKIPAFIIKRPGLDYFLFQISKHYEIIIFTAARKRYADLIIDKIDPKRRITHRVYRNHTICLNQTFHLKNLQVLGRNLRNTIFVDDNPLAGALQPQNFYKIQPFTGDIKDRNLIGLADFLKFLSFQQNIQSVQVQRKKYEEMQIKIIEQCKENIYVTNFSNKYQKNKLSNKTQQNISQLKEKEKTIKKQKQRGNTHKSVNSQVEELLTKNQKENQPISKIR